MKNHFYYYWKRMPLRLLLPLVALLSLSYSFVAFADGTETLGSPSISVADGTEIIIGGAGLEVQPGTINIDIPTGASIEQVLLYWSGRMDGNVAGDNTLIVEGIEVTGALVGGPTLYNQGNYASTYRADITGLNLLSAGANAISVSGQDFDVSNHGAGLLVIVDDGSTPAVIDVRDGIDVSSTRTNAPRRFTVPQTYTFEPATEACTGELELFFSGQRNRVDNVIDVTVDGVTSSYTNLINSRDGSSWDSITLPVNVPAGVDSVMVTARAGFDPNTNFLSKFVWNMSAFELICEPDTPLYNLGDRVWYDQDQNGEQDPNEPGYNGVTVDLYDNADCSGDPLMSTVTAAGPGGFGDGYYQFTDLPVGDYCVEFGNIPDGWSISDPNQGGDDTNDSDADENGRITNINLTGNNPDEDMGIFIPGSLGDTVICISTGEGLANIGVSLFEDFNTDGVADGPAIAMTETDSTGFYEFTGLEVALAGDPNNATSYIVRVDANDADLGTCNIPETPTETNPPLDSDDPNDPDNDFEFSEAAIHLEKYTKVVSNQSTADDLCEVLEKPAELTLLYTGDGPGVIITTQDDDKFAVVGDANGTAQVRILVTDEDDPHDNGANVWFDGIVDLDTTFVMAAANAGEDKFKSETHVYIYDLSGQFLQSVEFHTSCSQPLALNDQWGSIKLVGFTDEDGQTSTAPAPMTGFGEDADTPTGPEAMAGDTIVWTYVVTNEGTSPLSNVSVTDDAGTAADSSDDFNASPIIEDGYNAGDDNQNGLLDVDEAWLFTASGIASVGQYGNVAVTEGTPTDDNGNPAGDPVTDDDPSHYIGMVPPVDVCETYGKPIQIIVRYTGDGPEVLVTQQDSDKVNVVGDPNAEPLVFIRVTDNDKPDDNKAKVWFEGQVALGDTYTIDAMNEGEDKLKAETHIYIYDLDGNLLQSIEFHTSCSQPLRIHDQFGSAKIVGFAGEDGGIDENGNPTTPPVSADVCEAFGKPAQIVVRYTGDGPEILITNQDSDKVNIVGDPNDEPLVFIRATDDDNPNDNRANVWFEGQVALGDTFTIDAGNGGEDKLKAETHVYVYDLNGNLLQSIEFHTSCSQPLGLDDQYGSVDIVGFIDEDGQGVDEDGTPIFPPLSDDVCEAFGKPAQLIVRYTGDGPEVIITNQDDDKVNIEGDPNDAAMVFIRVTDDDKPDDDKANVWFEGQVALGDSYTIDAANEGEDKLKAETHTYIYDLSGNLLQSIEYHTSCSQPLGLDDQYGSALIVGFFGEDGQGVDNSGN